MRSKKLTTLGYLIDILNISVNDMAKVLYIDRTAISKWRTGARTFTESSVHFNEVVKYIVKINQKQGLATLEDLYSSIYPELSIDTPACIVTECRLNNNDYLILCTRKFLSSSAIPIQAKNVIAKNNGSMYTTSISVYIGVEGRQAAMDVILEETLKLDEPGELLLFDRIFFSWFLYDQSYLDSWHSKLDTILKKGHKVCVILNNPKEVGLFNAYVEKNHILNAYSNYHAYYFVSDTNVDLMPSTYVLKGVVSLLGYSSNEILYASIFTDKFTVDQGYQYLNNLIGQCTKNFSPRTTAQRLDLIKKMCHYEVIQESSYMSSKKPGMETMSEELLEQILNDNNVTGNIKRELIKLHRLMRQTILNFDNRCYIRHVYFYDDLDALLDKEIIDYDELSLYVGRSVYVTNLQYRQHLQQTARLLRECQNFNVGFSSLEKNAPTQRHVVRVKRNFYEAYMVNHINFNCENSVVNRIFTIFESAWQNQIYSHSKDQLSNSNLLNQLAIKQASNDKIQIKMK